MPLKLSLKPGEKFVLNGAVLTNGDKAGVVRLNPTLDPAFVSVYSDSTVASNPAVIEAQVRPLDEICRSQGRPAVSFMKVDVEGSELGVLDGGKEFVHGWGGTLRKDYGENEPTA